MVKHNVPYDLGHIPLHRLNIPQTKCWMMAGSLRAQMAGELARKYPSGVGVLECALQLIAYVLPNGSVRELAPPFKRFHMHDIANQPAIPDCICAQFFDPESSGTWKQSGKPGHHPLCQFDPTAMPVYRHLMQLHLNKDPEAERPDAWDRARKLYKGK